MTFLQNGRSEIFLHRDFWIWSRYAFLSDFAILDSLINGRMEKFTINFHEPWHGTFYCDWQYNVAIIKIPVNFISPEMPEALQFKCQIKICDGEKERISMSPLYNKWSEMVPASCGICFQEVCFHNYKDELPDVLMMPSICVCVWTFPGDCYYLSQTNRLRDLCKFSVI